MGKLFGLVILLGLFSVAVPSEPPCWTKWLDRDDPLGSGDTETLFHLLKEFPEDVCANPLEVEALTLAGETPAAAGDTVVMNVNVGFYCKNNDQKDKTCNDYKVRFRCPPKFCEPQVPETREPSVRPCGPPKEVCWTRWFDNDDPSGKGDFEWIQNIERKHPKEMCQYPVDIQARTLEDLTPRRAQNRVHMDTRTGFSCINREQSWGTKCHDYHVRFACYEPLCPGKICWTEWLNGDNPSRRGDYETLWELQRRYPGVICTEPLKIQAETVDSHIPAELSGQIFQFFNPTQGLVCRNSESQRCNDYRVRFGCRCK